MIHLAQTQNARQIKDLPRGWCMVQLGELCDKIDYGFTASADFGVTEPRFLRITDIQGGRVNWENVPGCRISKQELETNTLADGDIVFARTGGTIGKSFLIKHPPIAIFASYLIRLRLKKEVLAEYIYAFFQSNTYWRQIRASARGGAQPNINATTLRTINLPLPPFSEQKRIAAILTERMAAVEKARTATEAQLEAAKTLPGSFYREGFRGIIPLDVRDADRAAPPGWKWHKLADFARLESGHTPSRNHPEWWGGGVPWLALTDIRALDGKIADTTTEYTNEAGLANSSARLLPDGTVVLSRTASVGFVSIMGRPMATSQDFVNWVCGPNLAPRFLLHLLRASRKRILELASGAIHKTVYMNVVEDFYVCIPPIDEQHAIAGRLENQLSAVERLQHRLQAQLEELTAVPAAILRRAFSGGI